MGINSVPSPHSLSLSLFSPYVRLLNYSLLYRHLCLPCVPIPTSSIFTYLHRLFLLPIRYLYEAIYSFCCFVFRSYFHFGCYCFTFLSVQFQSNFAVEILKCQLIHLNKKQNDLNSFLKLRLISQVSITKAMFSFFQNQHSSHQ